MDGTMTYDQLVKELEKDNKVKVAGGSVGLMMADLEVWMWMVF